MIKLKIITQIYVLLQMHRLAGSVCYDVLIFNHRCSQKMCMPQSCKDDEKTFSPWSTRIVYTRDCILDLHLFPNNFKLHAICFIIDAHHMLLIGFHETSAKHRRVHLRNDEHKSKNKTAEKNLYKRKVCFKPF